MTNETTILEREEFDTLRDAVKNLAREFHSFRSTIVDTLKQAKQTLEVERLKRLIAEQNAALTAVAAVATEVVLSYERMPSKIPSNELCGYIEHLRRVLEDLSSMMQAKEEEPSQ